MGGFLVSTVRFMASLLADSSCAATTAQTESAASTQVEVCCDSIVSALVAMQNGAHRIELCVALPVGGVTPSTGLVSEVFRQRRLLGSSTQVGVLVRPRNGDFVYTPAELDVIYADISVMAGLGVDFVAVGALLADGSLDSGALRLMVKAAGPSTQVVCHRCVDVAGDFHAAVAQALAAGACRVLTSGGSATAVGGHAALTGLLGDPLIHPSQVCAASGITGDTLPSLLAAVPGLRQVHGSFRGAAAPDSLRRAVLPSEQPGLRVCDKEQLLHVLAIMGSA